MTVTYPASNLAQFYDAPPRRLRLNRETVFAISVAVAFHGVIGYMAVKGQFAPILQQYIPDKPIIIQSWKEPEPPPPPVVRETQDKPVSRPESLTVRPIPTLFNNPDVTPTTIKTSTDEPATLPAVITPDPEPIREASIPRTSPADPLIRNPSWLKKPTSDQISSLYPNRAMERGVGGGATLLCQVAESGVVSNCAVVDESPKGYRFGDAALAMTRYFRMNPRTVDGAIQAGSRVRIPIVFNPG